ncbi:mannan-binding protein [Mycolicibacterium fortuitum]|uniref:mannan-binding protein n=1 Tax=Mycolicibacterium fortuitum TaxID=1766 RepID=UPI0007EB7024|nr:mannan-binding family protein [Mycolicibacterium fortuitum]OBG47658.1 mannan-binding protein [Mycolicibacterium fortuitum]
MHINKFLTVGVTAAVLAGVVDAAPAAAAWAASLCDDLGAQWDGQYCHTTVTSERQAVRDIKLAIPGDLVDHPATGPVLRDYLRRLMDNWKSVAVKMVADSYGEENYQVFEHANLLSVVFRETYHADGPDFNNAYRTFTFDMSSGQQIRLGDLMRGGMDPLAAIPPLAQPYLTAALDSAAPPHNPGTYPFVPERWMPDKVYSGAYRAWALTPDELILYLPDYPVGHDLPVDYTPGTMQWSMDGGAVQVHIPLTALQPVLRPDLY